MSNDKDFKVKNGIQPASYQESLGTIATGSVTVGYGSADIWAYDNSSFSVSGQMDYPTGISFNNDGTKMYMVEEGNDSVYQYTLSTGFDLSTASYDNVSFSVSSQDVAPEGLMFNNTGSKMYVMGRGSDSVNQYSLSTTFDISTASYDSVSFSVKSQDNTPRAAAFNNDGTKMYISGQQNSAVFQYSLSTAFDLSTASYDSVSFSVSSQNPLPFSIDFNSDGTKMYILGGDSIYQYSLSTGFDISTASYDSVSFSVAVQDTGASCIAFNNDGTKMYMVGSANDTVFQYSTGSTLTTNTLDLSTGSVFEITPTSNIQVGLSNPAASGTVSQGTLLLDGAATSGYDLSVAAYDSVSFSIASQDATPSDITFKSDGTKMYLLGDGTDNVYQYSLSTAWDLSTASYDSTSFSVSSQDSNPYGIEFKPDGTKMYILGLATDNIYQYSLSTAWDVSTASYDSVSFSVSSQDGFAYSIIFNDDGTSFYVLGTTNGTVYQYTMSTAYDLSTASYASKSFSVTSQDNTPAGIDFNSNGTKLYMVGRTNDTIYQYSLSTAYDISTASYDSVSFSFAGQDTTPFDIFFKTDGTKLYMLGYGTDTVYQYTTGAAATITYDSAIQFGGGTAPDSPAIGETDVLAFSTRDGGTSYQAMQAIDGAK